MAEGVDSFTGDRCRVVHAAGPQVADPYLDF